MMRTTRWTLIADLKGNDKQKCRQALDELLQIYYPPLQTHLVARFHLNPNDAADILQDFMLSKVLEKNLFALADSKKGKFRSFVYQSLENFCIDRFKHSQGKQKPNIDFDDISAPGETSSFDVAWVEHLLSQALLQLKEECTSTEWEVFRRRILMPIFYNHDTPSYKELAIELRFQNAKQASNTLVTVKRRARIIFRKVVADYVQLGNSDAEIDDELKELRTVIGHPSRLNVQLPLSHLSQLVDDQGHSNDALRTGQLVSELLEKVIEGDLDEP